MQAWMKMLGRHLSWKQCGVLILGAVLVGVVLAYYQVGQKYYSFSELNKKFYRNNVLEDKVKSFREVDEMTNGEQHEQMAVLTLPTDKKVVNRPSDQIVNRPSDQTEEKVQTVQNSAEINVIIIFTNAQANPALTEKFKVTVTSLLSLTSTPIALHILGDLESQTIAANIVNENSKLTNYRIVGLDIDKITKQLYDIVRDMQKYFSVQRSYYNDALFFMSIAIHRVLPEEIHRVIMLDSDLKFNADIKDLYALFSNFSDTNIMGIAHDGQPVYRHRFSLYRSKNKGTRVGDPPPDGLAGFNSGVLLLDLDRMRKSSVYNSLISAEVAEALTKKYSFSGHLGDQCFFTLLSLEHEDLFYVLPCTWNRQLCEWWRGKGYDDVFDLYFKCDGHINIYHGNCNTKIPDTS